VGDASRHPFVAAVARTIDAHGLLAPGERVVAAVSGGPDSVVLAAALAALAQEAERRYALHVAHLDHGLRGAEAEADARFVRDLADRLGLPATISRRAVPALRRRGESLEAAARRVRYDFLDDVAEQTGAAAVAVGHTRDDQVETVLFRLLRGGSLGDLGGMPIVRPLRRGAATRLVRPLLELGRQEVLAFLSGRALAAREDRTNRDLRYTRNRIRLELLPLLEWGFNLEVRANLLRLAAAARVVRERLAQQAGDLLGHPRVRQTEGAVELPAALLASTDAEVRAEVLRRAVERLSAAPTLSRGAQGSIERLLATAGSAKWAPLGGGVRARRVFDRLVIEAADEQAAAHDDEVFPLARTGRTELPRLGAALEAAEEDVPATGVRRGADEALLDLAALQDDLVVRTRRPGDRLRPLGAPGVRKLQDLFVDRKVPAAERDRVPLVCDAAGLLWVAGHVVAERAKVTASTRRVLHLRLIRIPAPHA
jgi:tRNA(Ile)-lysidine synthase